MAFRATAISRPRPIADPGDLHAAVSYVILITPLYSMFFAVGLINNPLSLVLSYTAMNLPFAIYLLLGYLDTIPQDLDEAATLDGASTMQIIFKVILPIAWPGVVTVAVNAFVSAWDEFLFALTLMTADENKTVPVGLAGFFRRIHHPMESGDDGIGDFDAAHACPFHAASAKARLRSRGRCSEAVAV